MNIDFQKSEGLLKETGFPTKSSETLFSAGDMQISNPLPLEGKSISVRF